MENKITALKIDSFKVNSRLEMSNLLVQFICILKKIKLSKMEILVLGYFMVEGYNQITKEYIIDSKLLANKQSLANTLTTFRKNGILIMEKFTEVLAPDYRYPITEKINLNITLDNS